MKYLNKFVELPMYLAYFIFQQKSMLPFKSKVCLLFPPPLVTLVASLNFEMCLYAGYIEPVMVILHERELTWAGRVSWKHHTCMVSAFSISTTLKQHPLIWSAVVSCSDLGFQHCLYIFY